MRNAAIIPNNSMECNAMPVVNRIGDFDAEMRGWRRHLHQNPELDLACHQTAEFVAQKLKNFGVDEIHEGIATTGIVAIINGQGGGSTIGLRADMDALPIQEVIDRPYKSKNDGVMHACGHDGHTTMLLGAAKYLAETRNFTGRVALIFQPAEEDSGGGRIMCEEGMMARFDIAEVYGIHNIPGMALGAVEGKSGSLMAAVDSFTMNITGTGGHGAYPQECIDPIAAGLSLAAAVNTIVSRNCAAPQQVVISVTQFHSGTASNIIPETAMINGTVRTCDPEIRDMIEKRMGEICKGNDLAFGVATDFDYERGYPATVNHPKQTDFAFDVAREVVGEAGVTITEFAEMGAEDFSYMLEERPGAYLFFGGGDGPTLHHPKYDYNDDLSVIGASYFARLVEQSNPVA
jgi:amidohydrolase